MAVREPRHSPEEFARRGKELYDEKVTPALRPEDQDCFVAIDIESGEFAIHADDYTATELLHMRRPDAQIWLARVGHRAAYRLGWHQPTGDTE
jgi:hypothetical protein